MKNISLIIPIYKNIPSRYELISFLQSLKILSRYKFSLVIPYGLNVTFYESHLKRLNIFYTLEQFNTSYFQNISGYNKLMLSLEFYNRFINDDYILIYQLDSYIFSDDLEKWCHYDYDYIGAPWLYIKNGNPFINGIGNGGLSLRNPKELKRYLESDSMRLNIKGCWKLYNSYNIIKKIIRIPKILLMMTGYKNNKTFYLEKVEFNEDYIFGFISQHSNNYLKIPTEKMAMQFAFDEYPGIVYELNNLKLPFGCHGWYKLEENIQFWKQYINYT